jgi:hypothetical protein
MQTAQNIGASDFMLLRGQSVALQLKRGTVLGVRAGRVVVTRRIWLDNESLTLTTPCARGGVYEATTSEWISLYGEQAATVRVTPFADTTPMSPALKFWCNWQLHSIFTTIVVKFISKINLGVNFDSKTSKLSKFLTF